MHQVKSAWLQTLSSLDHEDDDPGTTWNAESREREPERMSPRMAWRAIQAGLPRDAIISSDIGNNCNKRRPPKPTTLATTATAAAAAPTSAAARCNGNGGGSGKRSIGRDNGATASTAAIAIATADETLAPVATSTATTAASEGATTMATLTKPSTQTWARKRLGQT